MEPTPKQIHDNVEKLNDKHSWSGMHKPHPDDPFTAEKYFKTNPKKKGK